MTYCVQCAFSLALWLVPEVVKNGFYSFFRRVGYGKLYFTVDLSEVSPDFSS